MGEEPEVEKNGGGWKVVYSKRKSREKPTPDSESRTGSYERRFPTFVASFGVGWIEKKVEKIGECFTNRLEREEKEFKEKGKARSARG